MHQKIPLKSARVVIGAGFGDEGKGLATDYYAADAGSEALVVRFNGGAQAGHTVTTPAGQRHVFSHIGSGALGGADTYLSRDFVCNPILFRSEVETLNRLGIFTTVNVDPDSPITTPYDIMLNQALEQSRGNARHGSCGLGFGETIERHERSGFSLFARDLLDIAGTRRKLKHIRAQYLPERLRELGLAQLERDWLADSLLESYLEDVEAFAGAVNVTTLAHAMIGKEVIFEGAQGLLLDMDRGKFPHVTRSNTGLHNVMSLIRDTEIQSLDVTYVSRAYLTRHGAGPLAHELNPSSVAGLIDQTNCTNDWQGTLRHAWLDVDQLSQSIRTDLNDGGDKIRTTTLMLTCLDQMGELIPYWRDGELVWSPAETFAHTIAETAAVDSLCLSYGPQRDHVGVPVVPGNYADASCI